MVYDDGQGFSMQRAKIVSLVHNHPMTISELSKKSGIPRSTLYHHLEHLKSSGVIYETKMLEKHGQPVVLTTNKASPIPKVFIEIYEKLKHKVKNK